jgi:subtilisin family serine protease
LIIWAASAQARVDADPLFPQEWWLSHIGADRVTPPGPGVPIAIIDSGVDPTHEEFANRPNTSFLNDQTTIGGEEFHGTEVASVAAAPDNGVGLDGVYPAAALEIWDGSPTPQGISDFTAIAGIQAVAEHCPAVINVSFGSTDPDPELEDALLEAVRNGCLVVAAAGNNGQTGNPVTYPASWPHIFTVGATDQNDEVTPFSTTGAGIDVVAPGVGFIGAVPTTRNTTGYETGLRGTSFSAPLVTAAAAWVWTTRPTLSASQVMQLLRSTARDVAQPGFDSASGWGIIDIPAALAAPTPPNDPGEPNDDIREVKPGELFSLGEPPLTTSTRPSTRVAGTLDQNEDPRDLYRIVVPPKKYVRVSTVSGGNAAARIWGPKTVAVGEGLALRRRDLEGQRVYGGKAGFQAYVEVLLTGRSSTARYTLSVTASKK